MTDAILLNILTAVFVCCGLLFEFFIFRYGRISKRLLNEATTKNKELQIVREHSYLLSAKDKTLQSLLEEVAMSFIYSTHYSSITIVLHEDDTTHAKHVYRFSAKNAAEQKTTKFESLLIEEYENNRKSSSAKYILLEKEPDQTLIQQATEDEKNYKYMVVLSLYEKGYILFLSNEQKPLSNQDRNLFTIVSNTIVLLLSREDTLQKIPESERLQAVSTLW